MARYSDKDKDKKKPAEGYDAQPPAAGPGSKEHGGHEEKYGGQKEYGGYGHRPPVIEAKAIRRGGTLRAVVYSAATADGPDDLTGASKRLAGVHVTITGEEGFKDIQTTGAEGETEWRDLPPWNYQLQANLDGYQDAQPVSVDLTEKGSAEADLCLVPEPATLRFQAFHDAKCCGDPAGQEVIGDIHFELRQGTRVVGDGTSRSDDWAEVKVSGFGLITVVPDTRIQVNGKWLQVPSAAPIVFNAIPGGVHDVYAAYQPSRATLRISAAFVDDSGQRVRIPGTEIRVYAGAVPYGEPLRCRKTEGGTALVLSDLPAGSYTILALPPETFQGNALEPANPHGGSMLVSIGPSGSNDYELTFQPARGQVVGYVFGDKTQEPLAKVGLLLTPVSGGKAFRAETGEGGGFAFTGVPAGHYELAFEESKYNLDSGEWVPAHGTPQRDRVSVAAGRTSYLSPWFLTLDQHLLSVGVAGVDGKLIPHAQFKVFDENHGLFGTFGTGATGKHTVLLPHAGTYHLDLSTFDNGELRYGPESVYVNQQAEAILSLRGGGGGGGGGAARRGFFPTSPTEAVVDIPYPLLTEGSVTVQGGWPSSSSAPSSADLGQTVQSALREVLNWRPSGYQGDAKGFVAALNQSFAIQQIEGHTEFTWTPRSYAAVQTGLGALTGAQASIFTRAQVARDQALPLLDGLYPLRSDSDDQDVAAIRAIVRSGWNELVNELGIEGGPRVLRVDDLFRQLTGGVGSVANPDPEQVGGQLGQLAILFGLKRSRVNTIDEEQNLTNFLIVADYTLGLLQSWLTQRRFFTRNGGSEPFLGTQLVLVERSLAVVAESVQEVYRAMDSVFLGREERQVVELTFADEPGEPSLFVAELLSWIEQVASREGPQLIKDGGKQGVISFQPTIDQLAQLAAGALVPKQNPATLPAGYRTARVQRALQELADHLDETSKLVQQIGLRAA